MGYDERSEPPDRTDRGEPPRSRRQVLSMAAASGLALAAGCLEGSGESGGPYGSPTDTPGDEGGGPYGDEGTPTTDADESPTESPTPTSDGMDSETTTVTLVDTSFDPVRASVAPGTTVEWVNEDPFGHDVTAAQFHDVATDWDLAESVGGGESVSHTFETAGVYEYYCTIHGKGSMCGVVLVGDASLSEDLPCEGGGY